MLKLYLEIKKLIKEEYNIILGAVKNIDFDTRINDLNEYLYRNTDLLNLKALSQIQKLDKEAYENELKIREKTSPNWLLLKDNIMQKKKDVTIQEEINKKFNNEYLNTYNQKLASLSGRKDAELEISNREYLKNNQDFQIILNIQKLALYIIESDGGLLFFDTRNKKYYFRSDSENNIIPYDKKDILVILNRAMQKNLPKYHIYIQDSSFHSIELALIENLNDVSKEKPKNEIKTFYVTKILIFTNQIPSIDGEVFDLSRNEEIFQSKTDLLFKRNIFVPKLNLGQNTPILTMTPTVQTSAVMQNLGKKLGLNQGEELSLVSTIFEGQTTQRITLGELKDLTEGSNNPNERRNTPIETRVALGDNSIVELVNGGVSLPEGVDQEFYVTKKNKNKK